MAYQGGKQKLGKQIVEIILDYESKFGYEHLPYFEPFVGFGGVMKRMCNEHRLAFACDFNPDIIEMWRALQKGWTPSGECSREKYNLLRSQKSSPERTLYGHVCSYGGLLFNGYLSNRDYAVSGARSILKITEKMVKVRFEDARSYDQFNPKHMLIYCDPPYLNNRLNTPYFQNFDHIHFWKVMRRWSKDNLVLISEYQAPKDFKCIWEKTVCNRAGGNNLCIEKIFTYKTKSSFYNNGEYQLTLD